ncbi:MAG: glycosyltransferase [Candidatus Lokiarchaeota archaeon]|nr:glycosyltransferase [Candidatus Lokiarchaeota archaeon]
MSEKKVSVLILTYNNEYLLGNLLDSIKNKTIYPNYEVYVIDNASTDGTKRLIKNNYSWVKYIRNKENLGFVRGYNTIYKNIQTDYYLTLNDDTLILTEGWISKLVGRMEKFKDLAAIYPVEIIPSEIGKLSKKENKIKKIKEFLVDELKRYEDWANNKSKQIIIHGELIEGPAILYKAEIIKQTKLFEPILSPFYYEDTDLGLKILRRGYYTALDPNVFVIHFHSVMMQKKFKAYQRRLQIGRNRIILGLLHRKPIDLINQLIFEFKTILFELFKLKINIFESYKYYLYILKNFGRILRARKFRNFLLENTKNEKYYKNYGIKNLSFIFKAKNKRNKSLDRFLKEKNKVLKSTLE